MTSEEVIAMAREAGFTVGPSRDGPDDVRGVASTLGRFAALVRNDVFNKHTHLWLTRINEAVKAEREACAKLLEGGSFLHDQSPAKLLADEAAKAIRARSKV